MYKKCVGKVHIGKSTIECSGKGVYWYGPTLRSGAILERYEGEVLSAKEIELRYPGDTLAEYAIEDKKRGVFVDAVDSRKSNWVRYTNHAAKDSANLYMNDDLRLVALCDIECGDELFWNYGEDYWKDAPSFLPNRKKAKEQKRKLQKRYEMEMKMEQELLKGARHGGSDKDGRSDGHLGATITI